MKGYLEEIFNKEIVVPKDTAFTTEPTFYGLKINAGGVASHGKQKQVCRSWMANLAKLLQYAYHRIGWKAFNIVLNVLPKDRQFLNEALAREGRDLISLILAQVKKDVKSYEGLYRIHLERDVLNGGGYHYHLALVARGLQSEQAIEIAFRKVQEKYPTYANSSLNFIAPDISRVRNEDDRKYFQVLGITADGSRKFLELSSDVSFEYMAYVYSYHAKLHTKESLIADRITIASGNHMKLWSKGVHRNTDCQQQMEAKLCRAVGLNAEGQLIH